MTMDLTNKVIAYDSDGTLIELGLPGSGAPTLGDAILFVLRNVHAEIDRQQSGSDRYNRYLIEKRITNAEGKLACGTLDLTEGEVKMLKERAGRMFMQSGFMGRLWDMLDGKEVPPQGKGEDVQVWPQPPQMEEALA